MVGLCGDAYRYGLCAGANELTAGISLGIAAAILIPYYLRNQVFTVPEFLELRYRKEARLVFSAWMLMICVVTKMARLRTRAGIEAKGGVLEALRVAGESDISLVVLDSHFDAIPASLRRAHRPHGTPR